MICPNCGNNLNDESQFCDNCGTNLANNQNIQPNIEQSIQTPPVENIQPITQTIQQTIEPQSQNMQPETKQNEKKPNTILIVLALIVIIGIVVTLIYFFVIKKDETKNNKDNTTTTTKQETTNNKTENNNEESKLKEILIYGYYCNESEQLFGSLSKKYGSNITMDGKKSYRYVNNFYVYGYQDSIKINNNDYHLVFSGSHDSFSKTILGEKSNVRGTIIVIHEYNGVRENDIAALNTIKELGNTENVILIIRGKEISNPNADPKEMLKGYSYDEKSTIIVENEVTDETVQKIIEDMNKKISKQQIKNDFLMPIEDKFTITGRGTVVTGTVERGQLQNNDEIEIIGLRETRKIKVTQIEQYRNPIDIAKTGDGVGLLFSDLSLDDVERGQVIAKPGSISAHTKFKAQIYALDTELDGGSKEPFKTGFQGHLLLHSSISDSSIKLPEGVEMIEPGKSASLTIEVEKPVAMEKGDPFRIRDKEKNRTIIIGRITEIIN